MRLPGNFVESCGTGSEVFGSTALKRKRGWKQRVCVHRPRHDLKGLREKIRWQYLNIPRRHFLTHARNPHKGWWLHRKGPESRRGPSDSWHLSEIILSRTTIRGVLVAREGARITQGCALVRVPAREREEGETYIWQIQRAPSCPSFLPAGTDTYGPGPRWVLLFSFLPACLSVCLSPLSDCLAVPSHTIKLHGTLFGCFLPTHLTQWL